MDRDDDGIGSFGVAFAAGRFNVPRQKEPTDALWRGEASGMIWYEATARDCRAVRVTSAIKWSGFARAEKR